VSAGSHVLGEDIGRCDSRMRRSNPPRARGAEMIALYHRSRRRFQEVELRGRFDPLGDDFEAQAVRRARRWRGRRRVLLAAHDSVDEHAVDLEFVDRESAR